MMIPNIVVTTSGRLVSITNPTVDDIDLADIGTHLDGISRWSGAGASRGITVATHSLHVAAMLHYPMYLPALLHDAHEAYLGDMPAPLASMSVLRRNQVRRFDEVIAAKFGFDVGYLRESKANTREISNGWMMIREADLYSAYTEALILFGATTTENIIDMRRVKAIPPARQTAWSRIPYPLHVAGNLQRTIASTMCADDGGE